MVFDFNNLASDIKKKNDKKEKIVIGALKYIAIKEAFELEMPLYENQIFRKYFTDFYNLPGGAFSAPIMQETFYRLFQSVRELYNKKYYGCELFKNIAIIISTVAGDNEKSFPSKILHTLDNDSPIIDNNVLRGLNLKSSKNPYEDLCKEYFFSSIKFKNEYLGGANGLLAIAKKELLDDKFNSLCADYLCEKIKPISKVYKTKIKNIIKDICIINNSKSNKYVCDMLKGRTAVEDFFDKTTNLVDILNDLTSKLGLDLKREIYEISLVKKIDFYLWAKFSK